MPELGKYAAEVIAAYAGSVLILAVLLVATIARGRAVRARLARMEKERSH